MRKNRKIKYIRFVITYNIVMIIPLVLINFSVLSLFYRQQQQKIKDEMSIVMERQGIFGGSKCLWCVHLLFRVNMIRNIMSDIRKCPMCILTFSRS